MPKYKLQEMSDLRSEGKQRVYPKMVTYRTLSREEFIDWMLKFNRGIPSGIVEAVLIGVEDTLVRMLSEGYNVSLGDLGTFSLSLEFKDQKPTEMQNEQDKMLHRKVGVKDINYKASVQMLKDLRLATDRYLERDMGGVSRVHKAPYTLEERIARALKMIDKSGFITLGDYASLNQLSRTVASRELKALSTDKTSPIDSRGRHSHKVWVRRVGEE